MNRKIPVRSGGKVRYLEFEDAAAQPRETDIGPYQMPQMPATVTTQTVVKTSATDRATGFHIATGRLSLAFVVAGVLIAVWGFQSPLASMFTVYCAFAAYVFAWLIGWIIYQVISPEGVQVLHALLGYRLIRHEQKDRQTRYRQ